MSEAEVTCSGNKRFRCAGLVFSKRLFSQDQIETGLREICNYYIFQLEEAPTTGYLHYQCYAEFNDQYSLRQLTKKFPGVNVRPRYGTQAEAINYHKKERTRIEDTVEWGTPKEQGKSEGLKAAAEAVRGGASVRSIAMDSPEIFVRHARGLTELALLVRSGEREKPHVTFAYGPPGTGKTTSALSTLASQVGVSPDALEYDNVTYEDGRFVGYYGAENVILDDFDGKIPRQILLQMLDKIRCTIRTVGSTAVFCPKRVYITSNFAPWEFRYPCIEAFLRRIDVCYHQTGFTTLTLMDLTPYIRGIRVEEVVDISE